LKKNIKVMTFQKLGRQKRPALIIIGMKTWKTMVWRDTYGNQRLPGSEVRKIKGKLCSRKECPLEGGRVYHRIKRKFLFPPAKTLARRKDWYGMQFSGWEKAGPRSEVGGRAAVAHVVKQQRSRWKENTKTERGKVHGLGAVELKKTKAC